MLQQHPSRACRRPRQQLLRRSWNRPIRCRGAGGFTLVELMVVLAIVGALLALVAPRYFAAVDRGRVTVQQANLQGLRVAIDQFYADTGHYPERLQDLVDRRYLRALPLDPLTDAADWLTVPPPGALPGRVYDVHSAAPPPASDDPALQGPAASGPSGEPMASSPPDGPVVSISP